MILARGRVHVEFMGDHWQQTGAGMAELAGRLPRILRTMVGRDVALPRVVVSDRGLGFYMSGLRNGQIVPAYRTSLSAVGFRPFAGDDASDQPPDCPDVLLHETAVGWIRKFFKKHPFRRAAALDLNIERVKAQMGECIRHINQKYDVDALCSAWPERLRDLVDSEGERLKY